MTTFLTAFVRYAGGLLLVSVPVMVIARRRGLVKTTRRFAVAAGLIGLICATVSVSSEELVDSCIAAGNKNCFDFGADGLQLMLVVGFVGTALVRAFQIYND